MNADKYGCPILVNARQCSYALKPMQPTFTSLGRAPVSRADDDARPAMRDGIPPREPAPTGAIIRRGDNTNQQPN
jgi:hypothetical protein